MLYIGQIHLQGILVFEGTKAAAACCLVLRLVFHWLPSRGFCCAYLILGFRVLFPIEDPLLLRIAGVSGLHPKAIEVVRVHLHQVLLEGCRQGLRTDKAKPPRKDIDQHRKALTKTILPEPMADSLLSSLSQNPDLFNGGFCLSLLISPFSFVSLSDASDNPDRAGDSQGDRAANDIKQALYNPQLPADAVLLEFQDRGIKQVHLLRALQQEV